MIKICKDCRWIVGFSVGHQSKCSNPKNIKTNLVTGEKEYIVATAYDIRYNEKDGCGRFGSWFEPKEDVKISDAPKPKRTRLSHNYNPT